MLFCELYYIISMTQHTLIMTHLPYFSTFQLYEDIFEKAFLFATGQHYKEEAQKLLQEGSISLYMERVIQRIESENVRSRKFLYPSSYQKVNYAHFGSPCIVSQVTISPIMTIAHLYWQYLSRMPTTVMLKDNCNCIH